MNLVCSKCGAQLNTAGNCIAGCRSPAIGTNYGWCGRGLPGDAPPLAARIAALEAVLHERLEALDEAQRIAELTTKAHDRMAQAREHDEAELAAERARRKEAEAILRDVSNAVEGHWLALDVDAHFARHKD